MDGMWCISLTDNTWFESLSIIRTIYNQVRWWPSDMVQIFLLPETLSASWVRYIFLIIVEIRLESNNHKILQNNIHKMIAWPAKLDWSGSIYYDWSVGFHVKGWSCYVWHFPEVSKTEIPHVNIVLMYR